MTGKLGVLLILAGIVIGLASVNHQQVMRARQRSAAIPINSGRITLPVDYRDAFVHYATVERSDGFTRKLYILPSALAAVERDVPLPQGTQIIIEAFPPRVDSDGAFLRDDARRVIPDAMHPFIHVAEKRPNWSLTELPVSSHVGDWNFGSFTADGQRADENLNDCFSCHDASASPTRDFIFSRRTIDEFARSGETVFSVCSRPDRIPCRN